MYSCKKCGAVLGAQRPAVERCRYCRAVLKEPPVPIATIEASLATRARFEPLMTALMHHYADRLGAGDKFAAFQYYVAFQFIALRLAYEVEELEDLEPMARPLLLSVAQQLGVDTKLYPGSWVVSFEVVEDLAYGETLMSK